METLLMWVGGISGLITVMAMLWRWAKRKTKPEYQTEPSPDIDLPFFSTSKGQLSREELRNGDWKVEVIFDPYSRVISFVHVAQATTFFETINPKEPPSAYRHLLSHLSPEFRGHKKEMEDFVQDGIRDRARAGKSTRCFVFSETLQLALLIGKVAIFKFRKSRRRTVS